MVSIPGKASKMPWRAESSSLSLLWHSFIQYLEAQKFKPSDLISLLPKMSVADHPFVCLEVTSEYCTIFTFELMFSIHADA